MIDKFIQEAETKFRAGEQLHGGHLEDKPCYKFMKYELIDLLWYYLYGEKQREAVIRILRNILSAKIPPAEVFAEIRKAVNLLETGNVGAVRYDE